MRKIGIVTHYYKSTNYGGNLQAYALCKTLSKLGYEAQQIQVQALPSDFLGNRLSKVVKSPIFFLKNIITLCKDILYKCTAGLIHRKEVRHVLSVRQDAFYHFNQELIPHSEMVYGLDNIEETLKLYDIFITGSDQVWHPAACNFVYRLDFVPEKFPKFSYAASIPVSSLTEEQQGIFRKSLSGYLGVSVREEATVGLLEKLSVEHPVSCLDPTLLLSATDWDAVCADRLVDEPYVFCYFLGENIKQRRLAYEYGQKKKLKIVSIPFLSGKYVAGDVKYSDILMDDASVEAFISLIKHASCIFTDSFHAAVFASIYEKEHFIFERNLNKGMNTRIYALVELFGTKERFCDKKEQKCLKYIMECSDTTFDRTVFEKKQEASLDYLRKMLARSEKVITHEG